MAADTSSRFATLTRFGWTCLGLAVVFGVGLVVDPRTLDGAPLWLKPAKFAVSIGIYAVTFGWILRQVRDWPRLTRWASTLTIGAFVLELVLIAGQAARERASHFNVSTPLDAAIFTLMGLGIVLQTVAGAMVAVALWRHAFADRALGWALRLGMSMSVLGASTGGLMTQPTPPQMAHVRATGAMPRAGQHSVGGEDGGPGLPGVGWSTTHGDIRVPHFVGLHAMQALPLVAVWRSSRRRAPAASTEAGQRGRDADVRVVLIAAAGYATLFATLLAQALAGQPLLNPSGAVRVALVVWALGLATFVAAMTLGWNGARVAVRARTAEAR